MRLRRRRPVALAVAVPDRWPRETSRWSGHLLLIVVILMLSVPGGLAGRYLCGEPFSISSSPRLRGSVVDPRLPHDIAYVLHARLGTVLEVLGCAPGAAGVQWLKAAAHSQTPAEAARAAVGMRAAMDRDESPTAFSQTLCPFLGRGYASDWQRSATAEAGVRCDTAAR